MRTITIHKVLYSFDELDAKAKDKALDSMRNVNVEDTEWYFNTYEEFKTKLTGLGYNNAEFRFSGFSCQGDGASFQADIDLSAVGQRWTDKNSDFFDWLSDEGVTADIYDRHCGNYVHENTKAVSMNGSIDKVSNFLNDLETLIEQERYTLCKELYRTLEEEYDYLISDEQVKDYIKDNEHEFTSEGHLHV
jgi:hypothetical protein